MPETICRVNGYAADAYTYVPVAIVGAGESGIAMGCRLKEKLGFDQFRIYERQSGIGGTWWINRYPGVACDIPAVFYSFSFCPNPKWTAFHPPGSEIVQYLQWVCQKYQIYDKIQLDTDVEECRWLESEGVWEIKLLHLVGGTGDLSANDRMNMINSEGERAVFSHRETIRARVLVSCVGGLTEPNVWPESIPGVDKFKGRMFHSARWDSSVDFTDKNVVVVGTGCSAAQVLPRLTKEPYNAKSVTQLMRSPPWVVPRAQPPGGDRKWSMWAPQVFSTVPGLLYAFRFLVFILAEYDFRLFGDSKFAEKERAKVEKKLLDHMKKTVPEKYHSMLTPDYGVGCKRRIFDATWFPGLQDPRIELTTQPAMRVEEHAVILNEKAGYPKTKEATTPDANSPGREVPADIIVLANGFALTKFMHPLKVSGREGQDLIDTMNSRGGVQAYQGTAMDGFPNFFLIFGPNTATGHSSVIMASESMIEYSLKFIELIVKGDASAVEVKEKAERDYTQNLQKELKKTVFMNGGCWSWYVQEDGWNATVYPHTQLHFIWRCMFPKWSDWNIGYTSKGLRKQRLRTTLKTLTCLFALIAAYRARKAGMGVASIAGNFKGTARWMLDGFAKGVTNVRNAI